MAALRVASCPIPQARRDARSVQSGDAGQRKALTRAEEQLAAAEVGRALGGARWGCLVDGTRGLARGAGIILFQPLHRFQHTDSHPNFLRVYHALNHPPHQPNHPQESLADVARKLAAARDELQTDMLEQVGPATAGHAVVAACAC